MAEIEKASEAASANDFIQQLDQKYDSMIGARAEHHRKRRK